MENNKKKILILGDARHGKDTLAEFLIKHKGYKAKSSSEMALEAFLFDTLRDEYGLEYDSIKEAHDDRVNHRSLYYEEITNYNTPDKVKLVKDILKKADVYIGLRDFEEVEAAIEQNIFDHILGVYNCRVKREDSSSNTADVFKYAEVIITNNGTLKDFEDKFINTVLKFL